MVLWLPDELPSLHKLDTLTPSPGAADLSLGLLAKSGNEKERKDTVIKSNYTLVPIM